MFHSESVLYTAAQSRTLDKLAIEQQGLSAYRLMHRAARAAQQLIHRQWPGVQKIAIFCGLGNNAGDGYVLARLLDEAGLAVDVFCLAEPEKLPGIAAQAYTDFVRRGAMVRAWKNAEDLRNYELIVDAILGTGLSREVEGLWARAILAINASQAQVFSLDIPTGLDSDTGCIRGQAIRADYTLSFIGYKRGCFTADGRDCCGKLTLHQLGVDAAVYQKLGADVQRLSKVLDLRIGEHPRKHNSHKGRYGHVAVVGGNSGMSGAAILAARAALRSGCGVLTVYTHPAHAALLNMQQPEVMALSCEGTVPWKPKITSVLVGPGLGQDDWAQRCWQEVLESGLPLVVDADALNLLARSPQRRDNWVLTPHPGEAARLLGTNLESINQDRFAAAQQIQRQYGGVVVLKGSGTLIACAEGMAVCDAGNPGMATAGMGDVLGGMLAALRVQFAEQELWSICKSAVWLHARAGDEAAMAGERGMLASDVVDKIRQVLHAG